jgi:hypothetical protein
MTRPYTASDLRDDLSEILGKLKDAGPDDKHVRANAEAAAKIASQIISSARAETEAQHKLNPDGKHTPMGFLQITGGEK